MRAAGRERCAEQTANRLGAILGSRGCGERKPDASPSLRRAAIERRDLVRLGGYEVVTEARVKVLDGVERCRARDAGKERQQDERRERSDSTKHVGIRDDGTHNARVQAEIISRKLEDARSGRTRRCVVQASNEA